MNPLNIIVICLDTFRADIVGSGGKFSHAATPALDRLASKAARFRQCYTEPGPTVQMRNGSFTGMRGFPFPDGYYGWHEIPRRQRTTADILVEHGYATGLIADTPHIFKPNMNHTQGFMTFHHIRGQSSDSWKIGSWASIADLFADYFGDYVPRPVDADGEYYTEGQILQYLHNIKSRGAEPDWFAPQVFDSACRFVADNADNTPFFLWVDCFETHEIFDPPLEYIQPYNNTWRGPKYMQPKHVLDPTLHSDMRGGSTDDESAELIERYIASYLGEVTFTDKYVGTLLDAVDRLGLADSTAVIFTSDHGTELNDHTGFGKRKEELHPFTTRLNMMIRHPDSALQDQDLDAFTQNYDLPATILDLAGLADEAESMDGQSLLPLMNGRRSAIRDCAITAWMDRVSIRNDRWNYVTNWEGDDAEPELYDHVADPDELKNVHGSNPDAVALLRSKLAELAGASLPLPRTQGDAGPSVGLYAKPLYATSYAPLFYKARMAWAEPKSIPK